MDWIGRDNPIMTWIQLYAAFHGSEKLMYHQTSWWIFQCVVLHHIFDFIVRDEINGAWLIRHDLIVAWISIFLAWHGKTWNDLDWLVWFFSAQCCTYELNGKILWWCWILYFHGEASKRVNVPIRNRQCFYCWVYCGVPKTKERPTTCRTTGIQNQGIKIHGAS